uniref:Uncharacterized protein n=1 Tax=Marseillevirus LCMAC101 TaxID=2506602 RepID=A0A481YRU1_9VIRU|nr:MAG: uncharacterized protein LCMAC101_05030 [Marseillevirus LCMAC101]
MSSQGQIFVGRAIYQNGKWNYPSLKNCETIVVMSTSYSPWSHLSPYCLKDEKGRILENVWQFSKVYAEVPESKQYKNRYTREVIWEYPREVHMKKNELTPEYWIWRKKGMYCEHPVRYPVGYNHRHKCLFALKKRSGSRLDYIESRKAIYVPLYSKAVKKEPKFDKLVKMVQNGTRILIVEVDGPHQESSQYYSEKYDCPDNFIKHNCMKASEKNLNLMLNDGKHPFGHGYCLAQALIDTIE